ncbi:MAG: hypothetical protein JWM85_566 [Acidimicrobiaceae bacterium]|nr:hypothetical protein [Acidimicrobiaceae bacterium]
MDVSAFDFTAAELTELLVGFAAVAKTIEVEPRHHQEDEVAQTADGIVKMHEGLIGPTFRVRLQPRAGDKVLSELVALTSGLGISEVLDRDGSVRLRHVRPPTAAS